MGPAHARRRPRLRRRLLAASGALALLAGAPGASSQTAGTPVYRCGNSYGSTPCPGGSTVDAADPRSAEQRRQAEAVKQRDAAMADQLAAERRAREQAAAGQPAVGIGPSAPTAAPVGAASTPAKAKSGKAKKKTKKPPAPPARAPTAAGSTAPATGSR